MWRGGIGNRAEDEVVGGEVEGSGGGFPFVEDYHLVNLGEEPS